MTTITPADMAAQIIHLESNDEIAVKYLGAAVVLQWRHLPAPVQQSLLQQAHSVGGLPPVGQLRDQIKALIDRVRG
jgi:hypothetical protein